jgi:hypothetical protein
MSDPTLRSASASPHYRLAVSLTLLVATCAVSSPATAQGYSPAVFQPGAWSYATSGDSGTCPYLQTNVPFCLTPASTLPGFPNPSSFPVLGAGGALPNCVVSFVGASSGTTCPSANLPTGTIEGNDIVVSDTPIPTLPEWGALGLCVLLALGGLRAFNRGAQRQSI